MPNRATLWQWIRGVALIITGFFSGAGMTLACALRNKFLWRQENPTGLGETAADLTTYSILFGLMSVWLTITILVLWRDRRRSTVILGTTALVLFLFSATHVFLTSYPVCNAF